MKVENKAASRPLEIRRLTVALGAEITGLDLSAPLSDADVQRVEAALVEHQVLFFRDQRLTPRQHRDLARQFGPLQTHPAFPTSEGYPEVTVLEYGRVNRAKVDSWHADMTFRPTPPLGTILLNQIVPAVGGDTLFSSMTGAFEALSDRWQRFLDGLTAVHSFAHGFNESLAEPGGYERLRTAVADNPPVEHPVVRRHPVSGARSLFVNGVFTTAIVGMTPAESRSVLGFLFEHVRTPELVCRFRWAPGSVAFWDNRATQHRPINDYWPERRRMQRVVIDGERPI